MVTYENFVFVLGSENCENCLFCRTIYFHCYVLLSQWGFVNEEKYRDLLIQGTSLKAHITDVITRFVRTGSGNKDKSRGRSSVSGADWRNKTARYQGPSILCISTNDPVVKNSCSIAIMVPAECAAALSC